METKCTEKSARLSPHFPLNWDKVSVKNLRVGNSKIAIKMNRGRNETNYFFELQEGEPVRIDFAPEIPDGMRITDVILNGEVIKTDLNRFRGALSNPVSFSVEDRIEIKFKHTGGIGMIPFIPRPEPGDLSDGYRIINTDLNGGNYKIKFEGKSGTTGDFEVRIFDQKLKSVRGADFDVDESNGLIRLKVPFRKSDKDFVRSVVTIELENNF